MKPINIESFMEKVYPEPNTGCWLWIGKPDKNGYGRLAAKKYKLRSPHRQSYFFFKGDFDRKKWVLHTCDQPACVNPDHLFLGNNEINSKDRDNKGRTIKGENHYNSKLNQNNIIEIRNSQESVIFLSKKYNVSATQIYFIKQKKSWKHI